MYQLQGRVVNFKDISLFILLESGSCLYIRNEQKTYSFCLPITSEQGSEYLMLFYFRICIMEKL